MKDGKATGIDEITTEGLKALDEENVDALTRFCNSIYNSGHIPTDMEQSIFIPLPKKPKAQNCTEYRTISLMSHVTKLVLKVIQQRITAKINEEVSELQNGFRPGLGTREGILNLRMIIERALEIQQDVYICFIDYTKAFDRVKHSKMKECLRKIGIYDKDLQIITKMYWEQTAVVRTENGLTEEFKIKKGVRQGCVLSSSLFNLYTEKIFREIEDMKGVIVGGSNINNNRYADDTALLTLCTTDLQDLVTEINNKGKPYGMEVNIKKTKTMVASKKQPVQKANITIDGTPIEQVTNMVYLGHMVSDNGKSDIEIKRRIEIARNAFINMSKVLTSRDISIETRKRVVKCYIWSTILYGVETWTISNSMGKKINALEMWIYRRVLRIPWTACKANKEVLRMMNTKLSLLVTAKQRKGAFFGHITRRNGLQRLLLEGKWNGKRGRGRPRLL